MEIKNKEYNSPVQATLTGIFDLLKKRKRVGVLSSADRLDGKRVLITGSSSGLGFATAVEIAKLGAEVIMAVRSGIPHKGAEVKRKSGSDKVFMHQVDFSDLASINQLVDDIKTNYGEVDIVICNAAMVAKKSRKASCGQEEMFLVNYLSTYMFVRLLLNNNCIKFGKGSVPRILFTDSESHRNPKKFDWDDFGKYSAFTIGKSVELYGYYKLLLLTFAHELSVRLNSTGKPVSVFALCPGPVNSNIAREAPALFQPLLKLVFGIFFRSPKKACEPVVYLAASNEIEGATFDYLFLMERKAIDEKAANSGNGKILWDKSEALCNELGVRL